MKNNGLILLFTVSIALFSCGKDNGPEPEVPNAEKIQGTYEFVTLAYTGNHNISNNGPDGRYRSIARIGYNSGNNKGTVVIDRNKISSTNFGYSVDAVVKKEFYHEYDLLRTIDSVIAFNVSKNETDPYTVVGQKGDSVRFEKGFLLEPSQTGVPQSNFIKSAKISWSGDTLILVTAFEIGYFDVPVLDNYIPDGKVLVKLLKKK